MGAEKNPPIYVYDTSGPYTDPAAHIDIRSGLAPVREKWITERNDTEWLPDLPRRTAAAALPIPSLPNCASTCKRHPRRAKAGMNVSQMHYARKGIITPEMEYIAIRENAAARRRVCRSSIDAPAPGPEFRRGDSRGDHA